MKTVEVLLSTYNGEKYLKEQILSLEKQNGVNCRILVRDDGSTDNTINMLTKWSQEGVLTWYSGSNIKPGGSFRNLVFNAPLADYYAFCDQDDIWHPNKLEVAIKKLDSVNSEKPAIYFCNTELVDKDITTIINESKEPILHLADAIVSNKATGCTIVMNKSLLELIKTYYPENRRYLHDWWAYVVCLACGGNIIYDSDPYIKYRQHDNNVLGARESKIKKFKRRIRYIFTKSDITRSLLAEDLLKGFSDKISFDDRCLLANVAYYRNSLEDRFKLAKDKRFKMYNSGSYINFLISVILGIF